MEPEEKVEATDGGFASSKARRAAYVEAYESIDDGPHSRILSSFRGYLGKRLFFSIVYLLILVLGLVVGLIYMDQSFEPWLGTTYMVLWGVLCGIPCLYLIALIGVTIYRFHLLYELSYKLVSKSLKYEDLERYLEPKVEYANPLIAIPVLFALAGFVSFVIYWTNVDWSEFTFEFVLENTFGYLPYSTTVILTFLGAAAMFLVFFFALFCMGTLGSASLKDSDDILTRILNHPGVNKEDADSYKERMKSSSWRPWMGFDAPRKKKGKRR